MNVVLPLSELKELTTEDFASDQEVRWCPGCGDYAILKTVQRTMAKIGVPPEKTVCVSGIGCSSRFPYYLETYGYHTIHGRAPAVATGVKLARPDLDVWIVTGDGDGLSIGGNHLGHILRRNLDCQILLFNNEIYGLTKGQASPTSRTGTRSPSTPYGSVETPTTPCAFAMGAGGRFIARAFDVAQVTLPDILIRAHDNKGTSFVEIYQNCAVFNDGAFSSFAGRKAAADAVIWVKHGEPLLFDGGKKGLRLDRQKLAMEIVDVVDGAWQAADVLVHDETNRIVAKLLIELPTSTFPMALGVIYCDPAPTLDDGVHGQNRAVASGRKRDLQALLASGETWEIKAAGAG